MKYLALFFALFILLLVVLEAIGFKEHSPQYDQLRQQVQYYLDYAKQFLNIQKNNWSFVMSPGRRKPMTFIDRQEKLIAWFDVFPNNIFADFSDKDWREFWALIYEPIEEKQNGVMVKRYRSDNEIMAYFINTYRTPFIYFQNDHWNYFWSIVLKNYEQPN